MKPKQLPLEGLPPLVGVERPPLVLDGESFDFDPERNEPWPMPPVKPWNPQPKTWLAAAIEKVRKP